MLDFVMCPNPGCGAIAVVAERYVLESTDGPVEHVRLSCVVGHRLNCPTSHLETL